MGNGGSLPSILALHHGAVKTQERRRLGRACQGGDLHYMTVCSRGAMSRVVLADVAAQLGNLPGAELGDVAPGHDDAPR